MVRIQTDLPYTSLVARSCAPMASSPRINTQGQALSDAAAQDARLRSSSLRVLRRQHTSKQGTGNKPKNHLTEKPPYKSTNFRFLFARTTRTSADRADHASISAISASRCTGVPRPVHPRSRSGSDSALYPFNGQLERAAGFTREFSTLPLSRRFAFEPDNGR